MIEADMPGPVSSPGLVPAIRVFSSRRAAPVINGERECRKCRINKKIEEFPIKFKQRISKGYSWTGHLGTCRDCSRKQNSDGALRRYRRSPEKFRKTPDENHKEKLSQKYGMTVAAYDSLLHKQANGCAICGATNFYQGRTRLGVDHDHKTGAVRGLLCHQCNFGIGGLKDSPDLMRRAIAYLEKQEK